MTTMTVAQVTQRDRARPDRPRAAHHRPAAHADASPVDSGRAERLGERPEDTLRFAAQTDVRPTIEKLPLARANDALAHLEGGTARFRIVLTMA